MILISATVRARARSAWLFATALAAFATTSGPAAASVPVGVWSKTSRVVFHPNATAPTHVEVHGLFYLWSGTGPVGSGWDIPGYENAVQGYLYYSCPAGSESLCADAWHDLASSIGNSCRGFGAQNEPTGSVRAEGVCPANPDVFPMGMGVSSGNRPCLALDAAAPDGGLATADAGALTCEAGTSDAAVARDTGSTIEASAVDAAPVGIDRAVTDVVVPSTDAATDRSVTGAGGSGGNSGGGASGGGIAGSGAGGGGSVDASAAGAPAQDAAPQPASSSDDGGCSVRTGSAAPRTSGGLLLIMAAAWLRRRKAAKRGS